MLAIPKLLADEPSNVDELGGAHERIAETIATLIRTSLGGRTIRLDGTWGAGKSTVVKMVAEKFDNLQPEVTSNVATDVTVFQYDAWVHVGDPLRQAFLSSLVARVAEKGWLAEPDGDRSASFWRTKLDELGRRLKTTTRKTTPFFSAPAKIVLSVLAALGIVAPMVSELEKRVVHPLGTAPLLATIFATGIVAFALIHLLSNEAMGFIVKRSSDEETIRVRDEPEPTSIEFQNAFSALMQVVLHHNARRLVIVIDNLDRIDSADTKAVWALLRSFLDNSNFKYQDWFNRLWVIVPLVNGPRLPGFSGSGMPQPMGEQEGDWSSFFEKVFQLRFTLPPPMLHSWKNYFSGKLIEAFGEDLLGDYDEILRLYEDGDLRSNSNLTPRGIVSFINELVALKLDWGDKVALSTLAAYTLSKNNFMGDSCSPPQAVSRILHETSLVDTFAMLHHRASSREEASYISVRPRLEAAMDDADSDTIAKLFKESPAFLYVLDRYIRQDLAGLDGQQERLLQAVRALRPFVVEQAPLPQGTVAHFRRVALATMAASKNLRLFNVNLIPGLQALLEVSTDRNKTAALIVEMLRAIDRSATGQSDTLDKQISEGWASWVSTLSGVLSIEPVREILLVDGSSRIVLPIGAGLWARLCSELRATEQSWILASCLCRGGDEASLAWLTERILSEAFGTYELAVLAQALEDGRDYFFDSVAKSVVSGVLTRAEHVAMGMHSALLPTLTTLFRLNPSRLKPYLRALSESGVLYAEFGRPGQKNEWRLATLMYLAIFSTEGAIEVKHPPDPGRFVFQGVNEILGIGEGRVILNSSQKKIYADVLADLGVYEVLRAIARRWGNNGSLISSIVSALAENELFLLYVRAQGDFKTNLITFGNEYISDQTLRESFVEAALNAEASGHQNGPLGKRHSLVERLEEPQNPV
jgi:hypothetical protein